MNTSTPQAIKLAIVAFTGLAKDALHIYVGLGVFFAVAYFTRSPLRSWKPWTAVLVVALLGECVDTVDELYTLGHWDGFASLHDILNTLFWPTVMLLLARYTRMFTGNGPDFVAVMLERPLPFERALAVWLAIAAAESLHGTLRALFLAPLIGDLPSRQLGVFTGSLIVFAIAWFSSRWLGPMSTRQQLQVGALWVALTVVFEFSLGAALGYPVTRVLADYNPARGGYMGFGLAFLFFSPLLAARARRLV